MKKIIIKGIVKEVRDEYVSIKTDKGIYDIGIGWFSKPPKINQSVCVKTYKNRNYVK